LIEKIKIAFSYIVVLLLVLLIPFMAKHERQINRHKYCLKKNNEVAAVEVKTAAPQIQIHNDDLVDQIVDYKIKLNKDKYNKLEKDNLYLGHFVLTAYTPNCNGCSGVTKTGVPVDKSIYYKGYRIVAVDPLIIPLYSILKISFVDDNKSIKAVALDTGGAIKNKKLDYLTKTKQDALNIGVKKVKVYKIGELEEKK
jgi:3D (Asp-Asp-Asp) domain-containing protein